MAFGINWRSKMSPWNILKVIWNELTRALTDAEKAELAEFKSGRLDL